MVPIISPGIAATAVICFIFSWIELLLANTITTSSPKRLASRYPFSSLDSLLK